MEKKIIDYQLLAALMDNTSDLVIFFNSIGEIINLNYIAKQFFATAHLQLTDLNWHKIINILKLDALKSNSLNSLIKKLPFNNIEVAYPIDGLQNHIRWSLFSIYNPTEINNSFILLGKNITDLVELSSKVERLDNIIRYAPDMIYWKDKNSIYLGCNDQFALMANYQDRNNITGKSDFDLPWSAQAKKFQSDDEQVIETGKPKLNIEDLLPLQENDQRVVISNKVPLRDLNGEIIGVLGIATDITYLKKAEYELQQSKSTQEELERLNNIIRYAPDLIYWKDKNSIHLGCNDRFAHTVGYENRKDIIGKSDFDFPWRAQAEKYKIDDEEVIISGRPKLNIPDIVITADGQALQVVSNKVPLRNSAGEVIGVLGITTDITHQKKTEIDLKTAKEEAEASLQAMKRAQLEEQKHRKEAERLAVENATNKTELDAQAKFIRAIDQVAHDIDSPLGGLKTLAQYLGSLEEITAVDGYDVALMTDKKRLKNTLYLEKNDSGLNFEVIGNDDILKKDQIAWKEILNALQSHFPNNSLDIAQFQKECLAVLLNILIQSGHIKTEMNEQRIPEEYRIDLREAIEKISDIMNRLLARYQPKDPNSDNIDEPKQLTLLSTVLSELLSEKRMLYHNKGIEFTIDFTPESQFAFVNVQRSQVNRAISNIINNAVQAFDETPGIVTIKLCCNKEFVYVIVQDNGKGMSSEMVNNIMNNIAFTRGKQDGHGIGLGQVQDTLKRNFGDVKIQSEIGKGSEFTLSFSRKLAPAWCAEDIRVNPHDILIILDDDKSIHGAWDLRFKSILKLYHTLKLYHFYNGEDVLKFMDILSEDDKKRLLLLTDFELLKQEETGISVIEKSQIKRAILVTSHYAKLKIQNKVVELGAKLLPKKLANAVPIFIEETVVQDTPVKKIDAVWLDDDVALAQSINRTVFKGCAIDYFSNPNELKEKLSTYPKNTPILLDNNYAPPFDAIKGVELAQEFHSQGFTRLYLITGERFEKGSIPDYLTVISKSDLPDAKNILGIKI